MSVRKEYVIYCDVCRCHGGKFDDERDANRAAACKVGWTVGLPFYGTEFLHLCPECSKLPRPEWWPEDQ